MFYRPRIGQAAAKGLLIVCKCNLCRRQQAYFATDLATIYRHDLFLDDLFGGRCPKCGRADFWRVRQRYPSSDDVGHLVIRRPAGERRTQLWRNEFYGPPPSDK